MSNLSRSLNIICDNCHHNTTEQQLLYFIFNNHDDELTEYIRTKTPLCQYAWITAQQLISIASSRSFHKSYVSLLNYFQSQSHTGHSANCSCMDFNVNSFNIFGITPFLKSLPCSYDILRLQISMGANLKVLPRCSLFLIINPLFAYMKHLVNQVYDQTIDDIDVAACLSLLCHFGIDPNYVPPNVCSNVMVIFSIAADISIQTDFKCRQLKITFLEYLDKILDVLLEAGLNPSLRYSNNKLSYEVHGDGLFDFIFMLKYPSDELSIDYICKWITKMIQYGCDPEQEMRSKCRDLLKFKLIPEKPNIAIAVFLYVIHELFDEDFVNSPAIGRINDVLSCLTGQPMKTLTTSYFRKNYPDSAFAHFLNCCQPQPLKYLARFAVVHGVLHHQLLPIASCDIPDSLTRYVRDME